MSATASLDAVLVEHGFERVDQAMPEYETIEPHVVYSMPLERYIAAFPRLGEGDLQIEDAEVIVAYHSPTQELQILVEGDDPRDLLRRAGLPNAAPSQGPLAAVAAAVAQQISALLEWASVPRQR